MYNQKIILTHRPPPYHHYRFTCWFTGKHGLRYNITQQDIAYLHAIPAWSSIILEANVWEQVEQFFFTARCRSGHPINSVKVLKENQSTELSKIMT